MNKTKKALVNENINNLIVAGGVAANQQLREEIDKLAKELNINYSIPPLSFCTDNAAMIAITGYYKFLDKDFCSIDKPAYSRVTV